MLRHERALREGIERRLATVENETRVAWEVLASLAEQDDQKRFFLGLKVMLNHQDALNQAAERLRRKGGRDHAP